MLYQQLVHWHEGLFFQPHHLQLMQNTICSMYRGDRRYYSPYPNGVVSIDLAEKALESFLVQLNQITAIMPSGVEVSMPGNAAIPALNVRKLIEERRGTFTIYLAVPLWAKNEANSVDGDGDDGGKNIYKVLENDFCDENTGDNPQPILTRQINARLVTEDDSFTDLEVLPLLRIRPNSENDVEIQLEVDSSYIPPCLCLSGSLELKRMISELWDHVMSFREELVVTLNRTKYSPEQLSGIQLEKILQLRTINLYSGRLGCLLKRETLHPFLFYLELRGLLSELAALQPMRDLFDVPDYEHENCKPIFVELVSRIGNLINAQGTGSYLKVEFELVKSGQWRKADLTDEHIVKAEDYFLAVQTRDNPQNVVSIVEAGDQFKLSAESHLRARVRGVKLKEERFPPPVLPAIHNVIWFRLKRSESPRVWNQIRDEKKIALTWSEKLLPQLNVALYVTVFEDKVNE